MAKPSTARSYKGTVVDDNAIVSINLKWLGQLLVLVGMLVYGYWRIESRLGQLEDAMVTADIKIGNLLGKHIVEETLQREQLEEKVNGEAGMIGVVGVMFVYLVVSMSKKSDSQQKTLEDLKVENRGQSETLANMESMIIKLIERWNKSDDVSLRHREDILREISDLAEKVSYLSGRINGNSK
jgi:hypothetical protein